MVKHCYECHSEKSDDVSGGLLLDSRSAIRKGGDSGPAVVPGDPDKSLLLEAMSYEDRDLQMPPDSKLSPKIVADFRVWIQSGAVDPRSATTDKPRNKFNLQQRRAEHWAWHSIIKPNAQASIDSLVEHKLSQQNLVAAGLATDRELIRRLSFDLLGLPPTPSEIREFQADMKRSRHDALSKWVNRFFLIGGVAFSFAITNHIQPMPTPMFSEPRAL